MFHTSTCRHECARFAAATHSARFVSPAPTSPQSPAKVMPPKQTDFSLGDDLEQQLIDLLSRITTTGRSTESQVAQINLPTTMTATSHDAPHQTVLETVEPPQQEEADADSSSTPLLPTTHSQISTASEQPLQQSTFYTQPPHLKRQPCNQPDHQLQPIDDSPPDTNAASLPEQQHISDQH